jgi:hypothetical protein
MVAADPQLRQARPGEGVALTLPRWRPRKAAGGLALGIIAEPLSRIAFCRFGEGVEHASCERRRMLPDATNCAKEASAARLWVFGWLAAAAIAVTAPALVASEPAEAQTVGMERRQSRRHGRRMARRTRRMGRRAARVSRRAGRRGMM